jgi:hypothetical protein
MDNSGQYINDLPCFPWSFQNAPLAQTCNLLLSSYTKNFNQIQLPDTHFTATSMLIPFPMNTGIYGQHTSIINLHNYLMFHVQAFHYYIFAANILP